MDFTFHGIPSKFFIPNSNLKDEWYGGEKTLYVFMHKTTHAHTQIQQQSSKYSASIFPDHACMTRIQKYSLYS